MGARTFKQKARRHGASGRSLLPPLRCHDGGSDGHDDDADSKEDHGGLLCVGDTYPAKLYEIRVGVIHAVLNRVFIYPLEFCVGTHPASRAAVTQRLVP